MSREAWEREQEAEAARWREWRPEFLYDLEASLNFVAYNDGRPTVGLIRNFFNKASAIQEAGFVKCFRGVEVPLRTGLNSINFDCLGRSWTDYMDSAGIYWGTETTRGLSVAEKRTVIIEATVEADSLDWGNTLRSNAIWPEQHELVLLAGAPVLISGLYALPMGSRRGIACDVGDCDYRPLTLSGNTGPANDPDPTGRIRWDTWDRVCRPAGDDQGFAPLKGLSRWKKR